MGRRTSKSLLATFSLLLSLLSLNFQTNTAHAANNGNSICFNGSGQYLSLTTNTNLPTGNDSYTIEAWISSTDLTVKRGIAGWGVGAGGQTNSLVAYNGGLYHWWYGNDLGAYPSGSNLADGNWHHVVAEFNGTTRSAYKDGVLIGSDTPGVHAVTVTNSFRIGGYNSEWFNGCISNLRIVRGVAVYSGSSFTVPTSALTAVQSSGTNIAAITSGQTSLLLNNGSNLLQDNSSYGYLLTNNSATFSSSGPAALVSTPTTTTLAAASASAVYGSVDTLTATVSNSAATGTVTFKNNGSTITGCSAATVSAGVATCAYIPGAVGSYTPLTAVYNGDSTYASSTSGNASITVTKATLTATPANATVVYGGTPAYSVSYSGFVNSETSTSSSFTTGLSAPTCATTPAYTTSTSVSASPMTITCSGGTSTNYTLSNSGTGSLTITKASTTVALSLNPTPPVFSTVDTLTATASVPGTVTFQNSSTTLCNSVATTLSSPYVATCSWTPSYAGSNSLSATLTPTVSTDYSNSTASDTTATSLAGNPCTVTITKGGVATTSSDVAITNYGIYCVATFKTVGSDYSFVVPSGTLKLDYLIVAGGGGGASGGGGGGGVLTANDYVVIPGTSLAIAVGGGGSGGSGGLSQALAGGKGSNSSLKDLIAIGGGGGGSAGAGTATSQDGGSGGGSRFDCDTVPCARWGTLGNAGKGVQGQGNSGGTATISSYGAGGGGGGAGGTGFNTTQPNVGGNGGPGIASSITGTSTYYGGGGGGGVNANCNCSITNGGGQGGIGGGGTGSSYGYAGGTLGANANATAGTANTGGGGGGVDPEDTGGKPGGSGVVILRWVSTQSQKVLTLNSNTTSVQTSTQYFSAGIATPIALNSFTRLGFVFNGWNTAADGSGQSFSDGASAILLSDTSIYAQWAPGVTHAVTFNSNTGSGTMANQVASDSTALSTNAFTKSNSRFIGWNTKADGTGFNYIDTAIYSFAFDTTMYAQWQTIVPTFTVTFYGNGADGGSTASQTASSTTALNLNGYSLTGNNFLGWSTTSNGAVAYQDGASYAFTSDTNLYAKWVTQANNTLSFDGNTSTSGSTAAQIASLSTRLNANGFVKTGYTFRNWNTASDGSGISYQSTYTYSFAAGLTLFAQWGQNITISYNSNTADSGSVPTSQSTYVGSPGVNLSLNTGRLLKSGNRLAGWNTQANGLGTPYALGASSVSFTVTTVLYAQWTAATYQVVYSGNGQTAGSEPSAQTFNVGTSVQISDNSGQLAKSGYTFSGWNTAPDGTGTTLTPAATVSLTSDTPLFAQWSSLTIATSGSSGSGSTPNNVPATTTTSTTKTPSTAIIPAPVAKPVIPTPVTTVTSGKPTIVIPTKPSTTAPSTTSAPGSTPSTTTAAAAKVTLAPTATAATAPVNTSTAIVLTGLKPKIPVTVTVASSNGQTTVKLGTFTPTTSTLTTSLLQFLKPGVNTITITTGKTKRVVKLTVK
jgi:uncharacterized repeat protein (TIGR02543 family)